MPKLWITLSAFFILISVVFFLYQEFVRNAHWSWEQLTNIESVVATTVFIGITLFVVAVTEYPWKK